jgi:hypothetical protein
VRSHHRSGFLARALIIKASTKTLLVFSGFNQRAVVAFLRVLERSSIPYGIIAAGSGDSILLTRYRERVVCVRDSCRLSREMIDQAIAAARDHLGRGELVIAPSTEALNRFFLEHRTYYEANGVVSPLVDRALYATISDKVPFGRLCDSHGIRIPREFAYSVRIPLPFVAKPRNYDLDPSCRPIIVASEAQRQQLALRNDLSQFYFQEYVTGRSFYLLLYLGVTGNVIRFSQENLIQQPQGRSIIAAMAADLHHSAEADRYIELLRSVGFFGLIMIEVRQQGDMSIMIEANPRFWGPSQLFVDAMPIGPFDGLLADLGFSPLPGKGQYDARYFWHGGLLEIATAGDTVDFRGYSQGALDTEMGTWLEADVYRRADTMEVYRRDLRETLA